MRRKGTTKIFPRTTTLSFANIFIEISIPYIYILGKTFWCLYLQIYDKKQTANGFLLHIPLMPLSTLPAYTFYNNQIIRIVIG